MKTIDLSKKLLVTVLALSTLSGCASQANDTENNAGTAGDLQVQNVRQFIDPNLTAPLAHLPSQLALITRESVAEVRTMMAPMLKSKGVPGVTVTERKIDSVDGEISVYIYKPVTGTSNESALFWTHGGGFILGSGDTDFAASLSKKLNITVVSVDYRLAPEHPFPAGHNDSYRAFLWMVEHAAELDIDTSRIAIGGDSA